jgi:succinyl-diaminopimelate desuccinylase
MARTVILLLIAAAAFGETSLRRIFEERYAARLAPLLCEAISFRTEPGNKEAVAQQSRWLAQRAKELGLAWRDAGPVTEIELAGPADAPVLGLVVHGDVQPAGDSGWTAPPFTCTVKDGYVYGRGSADDKGPLVQALLAMASLRAAGGSRTHTVRLLVGSDEESDNRDLATYLKTNKAPDLTLVLDSAFPVVVGEKAWDALELTAADPYRPREVPAGKWVIVEASSGIAASIVPPQATARLRWSGDGFDAAVKSLCPGVVPEGYGCAARKADNGAVLTVTGRAAHSGMNVEGGRNALVFLANALRGKAAPSGAADLLEFASMAGRDLEGAGLGLDQRDPLWGCYVVNVATLQPVDSKLQLTVNLRRIPPMTAGQIKAHLARIAAGFNRERGTSLEMGGYFEDEPFVVPPDAKLVRRLLAIYKRATGEDARPAIAGGGTYAKRLPNAVAFGMWFPGKPYPGHDVDERIPITDLKRGAHVLLEALQDLAFSVPIVEPLRP